VDEVPRFDEVVVAFAGPDGIFHTPDDQAVPITSAVYDPAMSVVLSSSESVNDRMSPRVTQPTSPTRSGGPQSAVSWASLGLEGRAFVSGGPTTCRPAIRGGGAWPTPIVIASVWPSSIGTHARTRTSRPSTPVGTIA